MREIICARTARETWSAPTREKLRETYLQSGFRLANLLFDEDQWDESMHVCHDLLAHDPCNEPAFRILMSCHAARGNRSAVHSVFQRCTAALREDLDVEPSAETIALYQAVNPIKRVFLKYKTSGDSINHRW